jgi:hypothetical protein
MNTKYLVYICQKGRVIRRLYLPIIPRMGEQVSIYVSKEHKFISYEVVNIEYIVDAPSNLEPIIKLHI